MTATGPTPASGRPPPPRDLTAFAWLAIATALVTMALKAGAWWITGSVGLLSDALESSVNLVAAVVALISLRAASMPPDANHHFGHSKAEYFSAAVEGVMILVAATAIIATAVERLLNPEPIHNVGAGLVISLIAGALNGIVAVILLRAGRRHRSITLTADGRHLLTDLWTSIGVVVGVALVALTGWQRLDPIVAMIVGINILVTGWKLIRSSVDGLMDVTWPAKDNARLAEIIAAHAPEPMYVHGLRTREAGRARFMTMHLLVPGAWSVQEGHDRIEEIEGAVRAEFADAQIFIHLEPREDPRAYGDFDHEVVVYADEGVVVAGDDDEARPEGESPQH